MWHSMNRISGCLPRSHCLLLNRNEISENLMQGIKTFLQVREQHLAGRAAWPRREAEIHVQSSAPCSRSPLSPCRTAAELRRPTKRWQRPSLRRKPNQTPR